MKRGYKGSMPINKVGAIVLVILVVVILFIGFQNWHGQIIDNFLSNLQFPSPMG